MQYHYAVNAPFVDDAARRIHAMLNVHFVFPAQRLRCVTASHEIASFRMIKRTDFSFQLLLWINNGA
jgi:hypothetical protein